MKLKASEILSQLSGALLSSMSKSDVPSALNSFGPHLVGHSNMRVAGDRMVLMLWELVTGLQSLLLVS